MTSSKGAKRPHFCLTQGGKSTISKLPLRIASQQCQCDRCKEYFNSISAFDRHQRLLRSGDVRCLSPLEMTAKGMQKNRAGYWITRPRKGMEHYHKNQEAA